MDTVGIGFVGAGEVSVMHSRGIQNIPYAKVVGLWNRTASTAERRAREEGCKMYATPEECVNDPEVDAVFVMTNLETHLEYTRMAIEAGKHVLCEKPLCASTEDVRKMKAIADASNVVCMPGHNMIHEEGIFRARDMIQRGDLGKIVSCYVMYNIHHSEERALTLPGTTRHILTHNLYTMMFLAGRPRRISGFQANRHYKELDQEDITLVNVELENGGLAHLCASFAADDLSTAPWTFTIKVIGTKGSTHYTYNDWACAGAGLSHSKTYNAYQDTLSNEVRYFIERCILNGEAPPSTLEDGIWAQMATEAVEKSIAEGITVDVG
ncbi:MAG: Gfo/Idh/MocA family oxidoreductase [Kiritimatiellia bacterium]|jgi:predicted dehydrogenase|nr:Gfo/Idh/MocA family oxidoreductase [Kiritimatiellia bacterium]MDP6848191.1 Gfo/Idh/MocA family oxidoreductase [Kiritimatiellia bacterium]